MLSDHALTADPNCQSPCNIVGEVDDQSAHNELQENGHVVSQVRKKHDRWTRGSDVVAGGQR